jgi:hypothetical protein
MNIEEFYSSYSSRDIFRVITSRKMKLEMYIKLLLLMGFRIPLEAEIIVTCYWPDTGFRLVTGFTDIHNS